MDTEVDLNLIGIKKKIKPKDILSIDLKKDLYFQNIFGDLIDSEKNKRCNITIINKQPISGGYGYIQFGKRKDNNGKIINCAIKKLLTNKPYNIITEAVLQHLSQSILDKHNIGYMIPKVHDIFLKVDEDNTFISPKYIVNFSMDEINGKYIHNFLKESSSPEKDFIICLIQICMVFYLLEEYLYLNHRDLRYSNIFIVKENKNIELKIKDKIYKTRSQFHVCILDFGFACIGKDTIVLNSANGFILNEDKCMRTGRDLFYLIMSIWCKNDIRNRMKSDFVEEINNLFRYDNKDYIKLMIKRDEHSKWPHDITNTNGSDFNYPPLSPENLIEKLFSIWYKHF